MRAIVLASMAGCLLFLAGCGPKAAASTEPDKPTAGPPGAPQNGGGGIAPIGPNVGGITPVTGSQELGSGTGGGIAQAMKNKAKAQADEQSSRGAPGEEESGQ